MCFKIPNPGRLRRQIPHPGKSIDDPALKAFPTFCFSEGTRWNETEAQADNFIHDRVTVFCLFKPRFIYAKVLMEKLLLVFTVTPSKIKIKTVQQIEQPRIWQMNWSKYAKTLAKIQVGEICYSFMRDIQDIQRNVPKNAPLYLVSRFASMIWLKNKKLKLTPQS